MSLFHTTINTKEIGKVFSVFELVLLSMQIPGYLLGGLLVDHFGTAIVMGFATVLQIIPLGLIGVKKSLVKVLG